VSGFYTLLTEVNFTIEVIGKNTLADFAFVAVKKHPRLTPTKNDKK
jgi:hypothetical protein